MLFVVLIRFMLTFERALVFSFAGLHLRINTIVSVLSHHEIMTIFAELCLFRVALVRTLVAAELALRDNHSLFLVDCALETSTFLANHILLLNDSRALIACFEAT